MNPAYRRRWGEIQISLDEPEIVTVPRAEHKPMVAESNWAAVKVDCRVSYIENSQLDAASRLVFESWPSRKVICPVLGEPTEIGENGLDQRLPAGVLPTRAGGEHA